LSTNVLVFENGQAIDLAVGRSSVRQRILALLMDDPGSRLHLREIQRRARTSPGTASRELARLVAAGLLDREAEGNQVYFRASNSPLAAMLRSVIVAMPARQVQPGPPRRRHSNAGPGPTQAGDSAPADAAAFAVPATTATQVAAELLPGLDAATPPAPETTEAAEARSRMSIEAEPASAWPVTGGSGPIEPTATTNPPPRVIRPAAGPPEQRPDPVGPRVARRLAEAIREIYGESARGVYLYGLWASGSAPAEADVETIVVLNRVDHYGAELERTSHVCAALSHETNLIVSRIFISEAGWNGEPDGVLRAIRAEAVAV